MNAGRNAAARRRAVFLEPVQGAQLLHQAIAQRAVKLQPVAVLVHAPVADHNPARSISSVAEIPSAAASCNINTMPGFCRPLSMELA